jgi:hypothetical protein
VWKYPTRCDTNANNNPDLLPPVATWGSCEIPSTLYVEGVSTSGSANDVVLRVDFADSGSESDVPPDMVMLTVVSLDQPATWETYGDNTALDTCETNTASPSKRIYPDKKTYDDASAADRKKVTVRATVTPAIADVWVMSSWWDVDDPSGTAQPLDRSEDVGGQPYGVDNRGTGAWLSSSGWGVTNSQGQADVTFTVTMNPGDNFKICSSLHSYALALVTQAAADGRQSDSLPLSVKEGQMLTVWRRLHVEVDSMYAVPTAGAQKNFVSGNIQVTGTGPWTATTDQTLLDAHMYENGTLVKGGTNYSVTDNSEGANAWVTISTPEPSSGAFTSLTDDDTEIMPQPPDTGLFEKVFKPCYIKAFVDGGGNEDWNANNVPFDLNVGAETASDSYITTALLTNPYGDPGRNSAGTEASDWWVVYIQGAYQEGWHRDNDPDSENGWGGHCADDLQGCLIFLEVIRDRAAENSQDRTTLERQIVAHEVGHQFLGGGHVGGTIMSASRPVATEQEKFSDAHKDAIRNRTPSPGN